MSSPADSLSQSITKKSASNLALAFILLPKAKRQAMCSLYAFCREVDDIADDLERPAVDRAQLLQDWRTDLGRIYKDQRPERPLLQELQPVIQTFHLPFDLFDALLEGVAMDLNEVTFETMESLETYCYHVASVVGLLSIEIFGYSQPATREYAVDLGKALQLTNILRDVRNDAERGRIYLPRDWMRQHDVREADILSFHPSDTWPKLGRAIAQHARSFYQRAASTLPDEDRPSMNASELMGAVYWRLLEKIERSNYDVFRPAPTRLSKARKVSLVLRGLLRHVAGVPSSDYGPRGADLTSI